MEQSENGIEPKIRLKIKENFKKERAYELTVRGDTKKEIEDKLKEVKDILKQEGFK